MTHRSPYGYDSRRRDRARTDALDHRERIRRHLAALIILTATAIIIIGWDYAARHRTIQWDRPAAPAQGARVTSTAPPHPATFTSHPRP